MFDKVLTSLSIYDDIWYWWLKLERINKHMHISYMKLILYSPDQLGSHTWRTIYHKYPDAKQTNDNSWKHSRFCRWPPLTAASQHLRRLIIDWIGPTCTALLGAIRYNESPKASQLATICSGQCCWSPLFDPLLHYSDSHLKAFPDSHSSSTVSCKSVHGEASCHQPSYIIRVKLWNTKVSILLHKIKAHSSMNTLICCRRIINASRYHRRQVRPKRGRLRVDSYPKTNRCDTQWPRQSRAKIIPLV